MLITEKHLSKEDVKELIMKHGLTLTQLIDVVIEINGFVGVGLISLGDDTKNYIHGKIKKHGPEYWNQ